MRSHTHIVLHRHSLVGEWRIFARSGATIGVLYTYIVQIGGGLLINWGQTTIIHSAPCAAAAGESSSQYWANTARTQCQLYVHGFIWRLWELIADADSARPNYAARARLVLASRKMRRVNQSAEIKLASDEHDNYAYSWPTDTYLN